MGRHTSIAALITGLALISPAAAGAAGVTVTNDAGQPVALSEGSPLQIRQMAPVVTPAFSPSDKRYSLTVTGPDGKSATADTSCAAADGAGPQGIGYAGNGTYAVKLVTYDSADDIFCEGNSTTQQFSFVIAASVALTGPASPLLYRNPLDTPKDLTFHFDLNPGVESYLFAYAYNATFGAGGAIAGSYPKGDYFEHIYNEPNGTVDDLHFPHAGTVSVVAAARAANDAQSPFSAPVTLKLIGPFDWADTPGITGGKGKTAVIGGQVFEPGLVGKKVSVLLAKGSGKFKPFVTRTIPSSRKLSFKVTKPRGKYHLKYVFKGSDLVAPGAWTQNFTVGKSGPSVGNVKHVG